MDITTKTQSESQIDIEKIYRYLKKHLDAKRYEHTLGVAYTAASLAMCYGENIEDAKIAGLLHDCVKCMPNDKKFRKCKKYNVTLTEVEHDNPFLIHGKLGAFMAKHKFGVQNPDIMNAISYHTTGRPEMSTLEKIIYIADYIEPNRNQIPKLDTIRKAAYKDLDETIVMILRNTLSYLEDSHAVIDPMSQKTYDYYSHIVS